MIDTKLTTLKPNLIAFIKEKANKECVFTAIIQSSTYIRQLNDHIDGIHRLSINEIEVKIDYLVCHMNIVLNMPMTDLELLRVRRCEVKEFKCVQDLSYIESPTEDFPIQGRMNKAGQALFYAALAVKQDDTALRVAMSEAGIKDLDHINVLRSHQKSDCDLNLRAIGISDHVRRNDKPYYLSNTVFDYYKEVSKLMEKKFKPDLFRAYQLTDRFLSDVLSRKGSVNLYQVTSVISSILLESTSCEGLLYSSVEATGEPVVVLKPSAVDDKIQHKWARDIKVIKHFGYEFYNYETMAKISDICPMSGEMTWEDKTNKYSNT